MGNIHIIIGDAHARPEVSNERFKWAGKYVLNIKRKFSGANVKVIEMGDWEDMPSLSSYDFGKRCYEGRRYHRDLESAWEARQFFNEALDVYNSKAIEQHKKQLHVDKYALGGNHFEGRVERATQLSPMLHGTIGVEDGRHKDFGWTYVPYMEPLALDGFNYCHSFVSGVMGRPISGETPALSLIRKQLSSCVAGHLHLLDISHRTDPQGKTIWGIFPGCYLDINQWEDYAGQANRMWKRGILTLFNAKDGDFSSYTWNSIEDIERNYHVA